MKKAISKLWHFIILAAFLLSNSLIAATISWVGGNGDWSNTNNWNPSQVPGPSDFAIISSGATYTVTISNNVTVTNLLLGGTTGMQSLSVGAFNLTVRSPSTVDTNGILNLNGSTLNGFLTVNGEINSTNGGSIFSLTVSSNAEMNVFLTDNQKLTVNSVLTNAGTVNWSGIGNNQQGNLSIGGIVNLSGAVFNLQSDQTIGGSSSAYFVNSGMVEKSPTTGTTTLNIVFTNTGTLNVQSGTVNLENGGEVGGTTTMTEGAQLNFAGGTFSLSGFTVAGAGVAQITGGSLTGASSFSGNMTWNSGYIDGGASLTVASNGVLNIVSDSDDSLDGVLTNAGTVNWSGTYPLVSQNGGGIVNLAGAVFNIQNDQIFEGFFMNAGLLEKAPTTGTTTFDLAFTNTGTVDVQSGTVLFENGGNLSGTFQSSFGAAINFEGTITLTGPTTNLVASGVILYGMSNLVAASLTNCNIYDAETIAGSVNLTGGSVIYPGSLTVATNGVLNIIGGSALGLDGSLTNAGTINWSGTNNLTIAVNHGIINLAGAVFNIQNDQTFSCPSAQPPTPPPAFFMNAGLLEKSPTTGTTTFDLAFTNTGTVDVQSGTILFNCGGTLAGNLITNSGAAITFNGTLILDGPITNLVASGVWIYGLSNLVGTASLFICTNFEYGNDKIVGSVNWAGGSIGVQGGGNNCSLTVASNGVLNIIGVVGTNLAYNVLRLYEVLTNAGTVNWSGPYLGICNYGSSYGRIVNMPGADFNVVNGGVIDNYFVYSGADSACFNNSGTFEFSPTSSGVTTINVLFTNLGLVFVAGYGTINFSNTISFNNGKLNFGINGPTNYGTINVAGVANLSGGIAAYLLNGYIPPIGSQYQVMSFGSTNGSFTDFSGLNLDNSVVFSPIVSPTNLILETTSAPALIINGLKMVGNNLILTGTNGTQGKLFYLLETTNLVAPATNWVIVSTNQFGPGGSVNLTNSLNQNTPAAYFQLFVPQ